MSVFPPSANPTVALYTFSTPKFTPAATPTDLFELRGSATKVIKIWKIMAGTWSAATNAISDLALLRRSTAASGGTAVTLTSAKLDSNDAAATAVAKYFTANPTVGTLVSQIDLVSLPSQRSDSAYVILPPINNTLFIASPDIYGLRQPIVLRSASEYLTINANGVSLANTWSFTALVSEEV